MTVAIKWDSMTSKKGFIFTIDAFFAAAILILAVVLISRYTGGGSAQHNTAYAAQDIMTTLSAMKTSESRNPYVMGLITNGTINPNETIIKTIGMLWALGDEETAKRLSEVILNETPEDYGIEFSIGGQTLYNRSPKTSRRSSAASRMISGIAEGETLEGSTGSALLKRIRDKKTMEYATFGGFTGQGNLTILLGPLPEGVSNITAFTIQADTISDFDLYINDNYCALLESNNKLLEVQEWNITSCKGNLVSGMNNITFKGLGPINESYIAGGYVKVDYLTDEFVEGNQTTIKRYNFPAIDGIINLYDSFYAPGIITDWYLNISFINNYTTYLRIGNETIFSTPGDNSTQNIVLEAHNLNWSPSTVPLRLGTTDFTNVTMVSAGTPADTVLVTDVSGSMDECAEYYTGPVCHYTCQWWFFGYSMECPYTGSCGDEECGECYPGYTDTNYYVSDDTVCNRTRLEVAQDADKQAVSIILNQSGNEVGLVSYNSQVDSSMGLTSDESSLNTEIDSYTAGGGTCICCGINKAKDMLISSPDKKFMIVMSDGDANYRCDNFNDYYGTYDTTNAPQSTIDAGQNACNNNITVFTIGFGSDMSSQGRSTLEQTACNSSLYYDALNESDLEAIYANISQQILLIANFTAQTITINGSFVVSHLLPGSYLDLNYSSLVEKPKQNEILIKKESPQINNCSTTLQIPDEMRLIDASITSYSGPYWTYYLEVNGKEVYNLSEYSTDYTTVGDPFIVNIPVELLDNPINNITLIIADNNHNTTDCSANNTIFYEGLVNNTIPRSTVLPNKTGCEWTIEFEDGHFLTTSIPETYSGNKTCYYTNTSISYDPTDAYDYGVYSLMNSLDFDNDGRVFINIDSEDLEIIVTVVSGVPYLWGPTYSKILITK